MRRQWFFNNSKLCKVIILQPLPPPPFFHTFSICSTLSQVLTHLLVLSHLLAHFIILSHTFSFISTLSHTSSTLARFLVFSKVLPHSFFGTLCHTFSYFLNFSYICICFNFQHTIRYSN